MRKISSILPSNSRISTVDNHRAGGLRPGMPDLISTPSKRAGLTPSQGMDRINFSTVDTRLMDKMELPTRGRYTNPRETQKVHIAHQIKDHFSDLTEFDKPVGLNEAELDFLSRSPLENAVNDYLALTDELPVEVKNQDVTYGRDSQVSNANPQNQQSGSRLDRMA